MENEFEISSLSKVCYEKGLPYSASIEIITKCNLSCKHCYIPCHTNIMDRELIFNILLQLRKLGVFEITLTGGEIFIHPDIEEILVYARKLGFRLILFSNLYMLDKKLIDLIQEICVFEVSTTLFSMNYKVNDSITGVKGAFEKIYDNILLLRDNGISLEIKVPIMTLNRNEYKNIRKFCDANNFRFTYTTAITRKTNGDIEPLQYNLNVKEIEQILKDTEQIGTVDRDFALGDYLCPAVRTNLHIDCEGNVYPCISFPYLLGNIHEEKLQYIWSESQPRKRLESIRKSKLTDCINCDYLNFCNRCPGLAFAEDNELLGCSKLDKVIAIAKQNINKKL